MQIFHYSFQGWQKELCCWLPHRATTFDAPRKHPDCMYQNWAVHQRDENFWEIVTKYPDGLCPSKSTKPLLFNVDTVDIICFSNCWPWWFTLRGIAEHAVSKGVQLFVRNAFWWNDWIHRQSSRYIFGCFWCLVWQCKLQQYTSWNKMVWCGSVDSKKIENKTCSVYLLT